MSQIAAEQAFTTIDTNRRGIPLTRLIGVELRKMIDTRSGLWLLLAIVAITGLIVSVMTGVAVYDNEAMDLDVYLSSNSVAMGVLLPILGIMTVTSEWGQRTSLTTFTLEPRRTRVIVAKFVSGLILALIGLCLVWVLSFAAFGIQNLLANNGASVHVKLSFLVDWAMALIGWFVIGFAFGMLLPNTAVAIVFFFVFRYVLPTVLAVLSVVFPSFGDILPWIDFNTAIGQLASGDTDGAQGWYRMLATSATWMGIPLILGSVLLLRREVK